MMEGKLKGAFQKPFETCHCHPSSQLGVPSMSASFLCSLSSGHPILEAPESVTGPWKGNVNIPCTYGPLQGYTQVLVKWLVQRGSEPVTTIFLRDSSGDHIQQAKYRGRLHVNHKAPGDVSLQLNTLEMDDRSLYMCEVMWQTPDGNQVVREKIIELLVQKRKSLWGYTSVIGKDLIEDCNPRSPKKHREVCSTVNNFYLVIFANQRKRTGR